MQKALGQAQQAIAQHLERSSSRISANLNSLHDITMQIGSFHVACGEICQRTLEKMAVATNGPALLAVQQDFIQSSLDNLLGHSKAITELMARTASPD